MNQIVIATTIAVVGLLFSAPATQTQSVMDEGFGGTGQTCTKTADGKYFKCCGPEPGTCVYIDAQF